MVVRQFQTHAPIAFASPSTFGAALRAVRVAAAVLAVPIGPAFAQQQQLSAFRLTPVNTPAVFYFQSRVIDCQGVSGDPWRPYQMALPATVVVPEHPAHGTVTAREGMAPVARCQGRLGPATIVIYTPQPGYAGFDTFKLRVLYDLKTHTVSRTLSVRVQVGGHGNPE